MLINKFNWKIVSRMYGSAHSSTIGFISSEWIKQSKDNSVLDGAPAHTIGTGRSGQQNADILLCNKDRPWIVVEVESEILSYSTKFKSIKSYLDNLEHFEGLKFGLLVMLNVSGAAKGQRYKHHWDSIEDMVKKSGKKVAFVSLEKAKMSSDDSILDRLRKRNGYSSWDIVKIDYRIYKSELICHGNLWHKRSLKN